MDHSLTASPFRQPRAVWAVAFACVVSFMGIGLVDPILPALGSQLRASPSQVELLFTSYLVVTAVAMLGTGWVSSRIGAKHTLVLGLVLIVTFAALAGASHGLAGIVGFRAGWGLGAGAVTAAAARFAALLDAPVDVLHVYEIDVVEEGAVERGSLERAREVVCRQLDRLAALGVPATGHLMRSVGDHADIGRLVAVHANEAGARLVTIGGPTQGGYPRLIEGSASRRLVTDVRCDVLVVRPPDVAAAQT